MPVLDCVPMLIPLIASNLSIAIFSSFPGGGGVGEASLTVLIIYIATYAYAKIFKCWKSDKYISIRAIVPVLIFVGWLLAFIFPLTSIIMRGIGNNPFVIALLSIIYKLAYDYIFSVC